MTWPVVRLGEICEFKYGKSLPAAKRDGGKYPVYGSNGAVGSHSVSLTAGPTIIVGRKGSFGEVTYSPDPCWPIDTTYYIDATGTDVDLRWLSYRLTGLGLTALNRAAAIPGLNRDDAYRQQLMLPSLVEQRRIAAVLDHADALRAKRRQILTHLDQLTQAIFHDMFGSFEVPRESVRRVRIGDLTHVGTGSTPSRSKPENYGGDIPWVKTAEVWGEIASTEETVTPTGVASNRLKLYPVDSIIVAMYGQGKTRGTAGILKIPATTNQACAVLEPRRSSFRSEFMFVQLQLAYDRLRAQARGGNQANLNLELVRNFGVLTAPLDEQDRFVAVQRRLAQQSTACIDQLARLDGLFKSAQSRAFSGAL